MLKGREVVRRPVVARETGEKVGELKDLIVDNGGQRVAGLLLSTGGLFSGERIVPWSAVQAIGPDTVIIDSTAHVAKKESLPDLAALVDKDQVVNGAEVQTTDGRNLGRIESFYFDEVSGDILGFELSGSSLAKSKKDRVYMPRQPRMDIGKEIVFVEADAAGTIRDLLEALRDDAAGSTTQADPAAEASAPEDAWADGDTTGRS